MTELGRIRHSNGNEMDSGESELRYRSRILFDVYIVVSNERTNHSKDFLIPSCDLSQSPRSQPH